MIVSPGSRCSSSSCDLRLGGVAGRDHHPDRARLLELRDQLRDRERRDRALAGDLGGLLRRPVVGDDLVPVADEPADHVGPHPAEPDEPDTHLGHASWSDVERGVERAFQGGQPGVRVGAEVDPHDRQVVRLDRREVAGGLGVDQLAERVRPAGDRPVGRVVRGQLDEPADRGAALVELAGRVQEARPVAGGRRAAGPVAERAHGSGRWPRRGPASAR